ncbi:TRAP transporter substrate-binding protein DctP [Propionivibrio soli]|uniref:TRAP transporter substrate-binding protein DctP n=1 Tax=Propionivibrio soli TaxID=2976531 RepID=UPI0021E73379|nr:TRAP transporter substrate-binding protein DctP [Propionivibrio soli]
MKRIMQRSLGVLSIFLALLGATGPTACARELIAAEVHPQGHIIVKSEELLASRLDELTLGALKITIKHSGQLGNENQYWDKVRGGSLDIARVNLGVLVNDVPAAKLLSLPYLFRTRDHMWRVLAGDFGKRVAAEVEKTGAVVLAYYDSGTRSFYTTKKPLRVRADFEGQRIRIQNSPVYKDLITLLGGTPVVIGYDKVIDAFKNGEIDGAENNLPSYVSSEHHKYARYYVFDEHSSVPEVLLMSKKAWDTLSADQKKAVMQASEESSTHMKRLWAEAEAQALAKAKKEGAVVIDKGDLGMAGIEAYALKLYSKYAADPRDLETVLTILQSK